MIAHELAGTPDLTDDYVYVVRQNGSLFERPLDALILIRKVQRSSTWRSQTGFETEARTVGYVVGGLVFAQEGPPNLVNDDPGFVGIKRKEDD